MSNHLLSQFEEEPPSKRSQRRNEDEGRRRNKRGRILIVFILVALVAIVGVGLIVGLPKVKSLFAGEEDDYPGPGEGQVSVTIASGDSGSAMGKKLQSAGVVKSTGAFEEAFNNNPSSSSIQPGTYSLKQKMSAQEALLALMNSDNLTSARVTVVEGATVAEVFASAAKATGIPLEEFTAIAKSPKGVGLPEQANGHLEGWLSPATYDVAPEETPQTLVKQMVTKRVQDLTNLKIPQSKWEESLTLASIAEKEVKSVTDMGKAARAMENRLAKNMPLQSDVIVGYGVNKNPFDTTDKDRNDPSNPYASYVQVGLPPTPIGNPSNEAIEAVLNPPAGNWLYWCTVDLNSGETKFTDNYEEHLKNKAQSDKWIQEHPDFLSPSPS